MLISDTEKFIGKKKL